MADLLAKFFGAIIAAVTVATIIQVPAVLIVILTVFGVLWLLNPRI